MDISIEFGKTRRRIHGGFQICGSQHDLEQIVRQIRAQIYPKWTYGWIDIHDVLPIRTDIESKEWDD